MWSLLALACAAATAGARPEPAAADVEVQNSQYWDGLKEEAQAVRKRFEAPKGRAADGRILTDIFNDPFDYDLALFDTVPIDDCADLETCFGANPQLPYGAFGFEARAPLEPFTGSLDLRDDEALMITGLFPPKANYASFTPYLFDRHAPLTVPEGAPNPGGYNATTQRFTYFASLTDSVNNKDLEQRCGEEPWSRPFTIMYVTSQEVEDAVIERFGADEDHDGCFVVVRLPGAMLHFLSRNGDLEQDLIADRFFLLNRAATFEPRPCFLFPWWTCQSSESVQSTWELFAPVLTFGFRMRLRDAPASLTLFTEEQVRAGLKTVYTNNPSEARLSGAIDNLAATALSEVLQEFGSKGFAGFPVSGLGFFPPAVQAYTIGLDCLRAVRPLTNPPNDPTGDIVIDPATGLPVLVPVSCLGDVTDTNYFLGGTFPLPGPLDFMLVIGANHERTGKATYTNVAAYDLLKQYSPKALTDEELVVPQDVLSRFGVLPDIVASEEIFITAFARSCTALVGTIFDGIPCAELEFGEYPGIPAGAPVQITQRSYVEPVSETSQSDNARPSRLTIETPRTIVVVHQ